uniref:Esterase n=1 Tax=Oryza glaberrima TaxID=4538 RepID=I1NLE8_ORYGL
MGSCLPCAATSLLLLQLAVLASLSAAGHRRYHSIFNFGDSFADTGNKPVAYAWYSLPSNVMRPPYGETFFGHPTGRSSDGRLILDLIAAGLGLPFVPPYLAHGGSFGGGANFAVAGATALDAGFFHDRDIPGAGSKFPLNTSLDVQLAWFKSLTPSLCGTAQECEEFFGGSLFFVGEFGVNDYFLFLKKRSVRQTRSLVPLVVKTISMAIERLMKHGAKSIVIPEMIPSGCSPPAVTSFYGRAGPADYDARTGCLRERSTS